jgi:GNAT superfamily N-acetyltransferase
VTVVRPAREEELDAIAAAGREGYAADMVEHGGFDEDAARRKAEADYERVLAMPTQAFYVVEENGEPVGRLWIADQDFGGVPALFVYEVFVEEEHRGRGFGRLAMRYAEEEARRRGRELIALNVFGGNEVARGLYRSLGYVESFVGMRKKLS